MNQRDILVVDMARDLYNYHGTRACSFGVVRIGLLFLAGSRAFELVVANAIERPAAKGDLIFSARYALAAMERLAYLAGSFWAWDAYETLLRISYPVTEDELDLST